MLRRDKEALDQLEMTFPGMWKSILAREEAKYPARPDYESENTADVGYFVCGLTIRLTTATTKFVLGPDDRRPGRYICNTCEKFFDQHSN